MSISSNTKKMKLLLFIFIATNCGLSLYSQNFYTIEKVGTKYSKDQLEEAINKADWCGYFYVSKRRKLRFDDGSVIELYSFNELSNKNICKNKTITNSMEFEDIEQEELNIGKLGIEKQNLFNPQNKLSIGQKIEDKLPIEQFFLIDDKPVTREQYLLFLSEKSKN